MWPPLPAADHTKPISRWLHESGDNYLDTPRDTTREKIAFGGTPTADQLLALSTEIKTFTQGTQSASEIGELIGGARRLVFLGFGFHRLNMKLLFEKQRARNAAVIATGMGLSLGDALKLQDQLRQLTGSDRGDVNVHSESGCAGLFEAERFGLTLAE